MASRGRTVALIGIVAAMSYVLGMVGVTAPSGGRVSLADLPVLVLALTVGTRAGVTAGALTGLLHFSQQPFVMHPFAFILDYPLSGACLGLAGLFRGGRAEVGVGVAVTMKYLVHVLSGVLFWSQGLSLSAALTFSAAYNATYMGPMLLIDLLMLAPLLPRLRGRLSG